MSTLKYYNGSSWVKTNSYSYYDGIVQRGSNSNGNWTKFADGTMICTLNITVTDQAINSAYGSLYTGSRLWTFPQAFVDTPAVSCGLFNWNSSASWGSTYSPTVNQVYLRGIDAVSRASGTSCRIQAIAIGKWK